jgi:hypothetical protein
MLGDLLFNHINRIKIELSCKDCRSKGFPYQKFRICLI